MSPNNAQVLSFGSILLTPNEHHTSMAISTFFTVEKKSLNRRTVTSEVAIHLSYADLSFCLFHLFGRLLIRTIVFVYFGIGKFMKQTYTRSNQKYYDYMYTLYVPTGIYVISTSILTTYYCLIPID